MFSTTYSAVIKNINIENFEISINSDIIENLEEGQNLTTGIGSIVGFLQKSNLCNCHCSGSLKIQNNNTIIKNMAQNYCFGFICGKSEISTISNCYADNSKFKFNIECNTYPLCFGCITGMNSSSLSNIKDCYINNINISSDSKSKSINQRICSLVANNSGNVSNCFAANTDLPLVKFSSIDNCYTDNNGYETGSGKLANPWDTAIWDVPSTKPCFPELRIFNK